MLDNQDPEDWITLWFSKLTPKQKSLVSDLVQELQNRTQAKQNLRHPDLPQLLRSPNQSSSLS